MTEQVHPLITSADTVPGHWQLDILWSVLVSQDDTGGQFSVMEQLMPVPRPARGPRLGRTRRPHRRRSRSRRFRGSRGPYLDRRRLCCRHPLATVAYEPVTEWVTGMGIAAGTALTGS